MQTIPVLALKDIDYFQAKCRSRCSVFSGLCRYNGLIVYHSMDYRWPPIPLSTHSAETKLNLRKSHVSLS